MLFFKSSLVNFIKSVSLSSGKIKNDVKRSVEKVDGIVKKFKIVFKCKFML